MNKILVKITFPKIDKKYDILIPLQKTVYNIIIMLIKGINELNDNIYDIQEIPILYNKNTGENYDLNALIEETNIKNGTELILM